MGHTYVEDERVMFCLTGIGTIGGGGGFATLGSLTGIKTACLVLNLEEFHHATFLGPTSPSLLGILHRGCVLITEPKTALVGKFAFSLCAHASSTHGMILVTLYEARLVRGTDQSKMSMRASGRTKQWSSRVPGGHIPARVRHGRQPLISSMSGDSGTRRARKLPRPG